MFKYRFLFAQAALTILVVGTAHAGADRYVPAVTNPILNETPYITTEARPFYMYHTIPDKILTGGGHINLYALQLRVAITERLGFIATKDGYADLDFSGASSALNDGDFANLAAGFKYALIDEAENDRIVTAGIRYEAPTGTLNAGPISLQGKGDGFINGFLTGAQRFSERCGAQGSIGLNAALDSDHDSTMIHASAVGDYEILDDFLFGLFELNMMSVVDEGDRTDGLGGFEGVDVVNFGSTEAGTVFTAGVSARVKISENFLFGAAWETSFGGREDIFDDRITIDAILKM